MVRRIRVIDVQVLPRVCSRAAAKWLAILSRAGPCSVKMSVRGSKSVLSMWPAKVRKVPKVDGRRKM